MTCEPRRPTLALWMLAQVAIELVWLTAAAWARFRQVRVVCRVLGHAWEPFEIVPECVRCGTVADQVRHGSRPQAREGR